MTLPWSLVHVYDALSAEPHDALAVVFSGAGGWVRFCRQLAYSLSCSGIKVVGISSLRYFLWKERNADETAAFVNHLIRHFANRPNPGRIILIGYSQGADVLPFVANRLASAVKDRLGPVVLIAPAPHADFRLRLRDFLFNIYTASAKPLLPEITPSLLSRLLCFYGTKDKCCFCPTLGAMGAVHVALPGGHVFRRHAETVASAIVHALTRWERPI